MLDIPDDVDLAVICVPAAVVPEVIDDVARALADVAAQQWDKPLIANLVGTEGIPEPLRGQRAVPCCPFPETAAHALARAAWYAEWLRRPPGEAPRLDGIDIGAARHVVDGFLTDHPEGGWLDLVAAGELLAAIGIPVLPLVAVASAAEAAQAAARIGGPVALKAAGVLHKTDKGGVRLDLTSPEVTGVAYDEMAARLDGGDGREKMTGALVQAMASPGVETIAGVMRDPAFGPLILFGLGGIAAELVGDRAVRVAPLTDHDAADLVRSLRSSPLLFGFRGTPTTDVAALEDVLLRLSVLGQQMPEVAEMDLNPLIARPEGIVAVDWRIRLTPADRNPQRDLRRLR